MGIQARAMQIVRPHGQQFRPDMPNAFPLTKLAQHPRTPRGAARHTRGQPPTAVPRARLYH